MKFNLEEELRRNKVASAPMAGVSDQAYRILAASYGCGLCFSEMVSDQALLNNHRKTRSMIDLSHDLVPVALQIFGSQPHFMARAAALAEENGARWIDINMGCPTPKIVKNGEGAALMLDMEKARAIVSAVIKTVDVPVTVKMRKGWDEHRVNYLELGRILEGEGVKAIILHARTRDQFYAGKADWDSIRALKRTVKIPVIGNGDIFTPGDALRMLEYTGCDAVMVGRGSLGNPFIFAGINRLLAGEPPAEPDLPSRIETAIRHFDLMAGFKGGEQAVKEMRKHLAWYTRGLPGAAQARARICQAQTRTEMIQVLRNLLRQG